MSVIIKKMNNSYICECNKTITLSADETNGLYGKRGILENKTNYHRRHFENKPSDPHLVWQIDRALNFLIRTIHEKKENSISA